MIVFLFFVRWMSTCPKSAFQNASFYGGPVIGFDKKENYQKAMQILADAGYKIVR